MQLWQKNWWLMFFEALCIVEINNFLRTLLIFWCLLWSEIFRVCIREEDRRAMKTSRLKQPLARLTMEYNSCVGSATSVCMSHWYAWPCHTPRCARHRSLEIWPTKTPYLCAVEGTSITPQCDDLDQLWRWLVGYYITRWHRWSREARGLPTDRT